MAFVDNTVRKYFKYRIGVDPGANGGLVCFQIDVATGEVVKTRFSSMPDTEEKIWHWFDEIPADSCDAVIEQVRGYMGQPKDSKDGDKKVFQPGSAMFNFGWSYGGLRMALTGHGINFIDVPPHVWQRGLGITSRRRTEGKPAWKKRLQSIAQKMYPRLKVTAKVADALLIATYCRVITGDINASDL